MNRRGGVDEVANGKKVGWVEYAWFMEILRDKSVRTHEGSNTSSVL